MKKIILSIACAVLCAAGIQAQVTLQFTSVNEYAFNSKEALNLTVVNANPKAFPVYFSGKITDANGELVNEFKTSEVVLNVGANLFSSATLSFTDLVYHNRDIYEIETRTGTFPSGNYTVCIWPMCTTPDCGGAGSNAINYEQSACLQVHIENPTPLILTFPEDGSEIDITRPLYTWIPPAPVAGSADLNFSMILVEILEGQTKMDALTGNRPIIESDGIGMPSLMHPLDIPELERGKSYAWQVEAFVGKTSIAKSEQWKFKVKKKVEEVIVNRYFDLSKTVTDIPKVKKGERLFFVTDNGMSNQEPVFIVNQLGNRPFSCLIERVIKDSVDMASDKYTNELMQHGLTKYTISIDPVLFGHNAVYELHVSLPDNRKNILRFEIIN